MVERAFPSLPPDVKAAAETLRELAESASTNNTDPVNCAHLRALLKSHTALTEANGRMSKALRNAEVWFADYERQHLGKCTPDGDAKAKINANRAEACRSALLAQAIGEGEPT